MWTYIIAGLAALAMMCSLYYKVYHAGYDAASLEWSEAKAEQAKRELARSEKASKGVEGDKVVIRTRTKEITVYVDREVEKPVYRDVCLPANGLCLANAALTGKSADTCKPDGGVSAPNPAR